MLKEHTKKLDIKFCIILNTYQPNGEVKISIPIPEDIDPTKLAAYIILESGEDIQFKVLTEDMQFEYVGKMSAIVWLDHFSLYVIAEKSSRESH